VRAPVRATSYSAGEARERTVGETGRRVTVIGRLPGEHCWLSLLWVVFGSRLGGLARIHHDPAGLWPLADLSQPG